MKLVASILSFLLVLQLLLPIHVFAEVGGDALNLQGKAPVNKVGALLLVEGFASIGGSTITVSGKAQLSAQTQDLLQGILVKPTTTI